VTNERIEQQNTLSQAITSFIRQFEIDEEECELSHSRKASKRKEDEKKRVDA
jgi:hypothetical protein